MSKYTAMKTKKTPIDLKKIPYYFALSLLTVGASLILGFLSFSGMYALTPLLSTAFLTFGLSVAYEGEIYLQNLKGALNKLFKTDYLHKRLAKEYLAKHFPADTLDLNCPRFFQDYKAQLLLLNQLDHKELNKTEKERKKQSRSTIKEMEYWFAQQLFLKPGQSSDKQTPYALELQNWLDKNHQQKWHQLKEQRNRRYTIVKGFSALSALFMSLGSTYLMVEAFSVIPFFAALPFAFWPTIIIPMALIAGTAYGLLTFNTVTDLINNNTVVRWYNKLKADLKQGITPRSVFMAITATFLVTLAIALTVCTAGTWWTIATKARPLFPWMSRMPSFIMGIINPIITGASAILFNIQNTAESLEMVDESLRSKKNIFQKIKDSLVKSWNTTSSTENGFQIMNPFRILLKLTLTPLRIILFLGHLVSISLTSDRMPGVPQIVSALIAIISEGFEDAGYFIGRVENQEHHPENVGDYNVEHQHGFKETLEEHLVSDSEHHHSTDIPTWILKKIASPLYALAATWDHLFSKLNVNRTPMHEKRVLSFTQAWKKQQGAEERAALNHSSSTEKPSQAWQLEHTRFLIEKQTNQLASASLNKEPAQAKRAALAALKTKISTQEPHLWEQTLKEEISNPIYNKHRLFSLGKQTNTQNFVEALSIQVGVSSH